MTVDTNLSSSLSSRLWANDGNDENVPSSSYYSIPPSSSSFDNEDDLMMNEEEMMIIVYPETKVQNVAILSIIFTVALIINLMALPVILFKRTKFGNGLFAVLILCLTISDLAVTFFSLLGSLIVESSHFLWGGAPGSCQVYHWLSAWMTGLSAYLLVAIVGMVMVKSTNSCLQRLRDCRWLLLAVLVASGIYALPELFIRSTVTLVVQDEDMCILGAEGAVYGLYVAFRLALRHVIPALLVIATILRPETKLSKRVSHLFFGHLSVPCSCGENGAVLGIPHECPSMQTAMLRSTTVNIESQRRGGGNAMVTTTLTPNGVTSARPDLLADSEPAGCIAKGTKMINRLHIQPEDPHRRKYKLTLSAFFIFITFLNLAMEIAFQVQSASTDDEIWIDSDTYINHGDNLATAILCFTHLQQIADPLIFLLAEFVYS